MDRTHYAARRLNPLQPARSKWLGGVSGRTLAQPGIHMSVISALEALPGSLLGLSGSLWEAIFMLGDNF